MTTEGPATPIRRKAKAKYHGICPFCTRRIGVGDLITEVHGWSVGMQSRWIHARCVPEYERLIAGREAREREAESAAKEARAIAASGDAAARAAVAAVIARAAQQAEATRRAKPTRPRESRRRTVLKWLAVILIAGAALAYGVASSHKSDTYDVRCRDGTISHAGGHQGACSYHGGEVP